ncbi:MAG: DNA polymerase III subunit delta' [Chloracidobacterium sp.]|uniref:DNA polymerase III subunit delta' n=1 Tax=Chloracidobacterium validum TaxID=2821543 RepID=A0ABX8B9J4_9BACT|nr:DNA polymerase III subunit delta' [Chloracidobacterium validum]QUW02225.1 DNA polymerase III subunit delta' [Chloracidobacterium validum]
MAFHDLIGQSIAKDLLRRSLHAQRLPTGLLFVGPVGVGKRLCALSVAQALNCQVAPAEGCGTCSVCQRIARGEHPDVKLVAPDGAQIKIGQAREAVRFVTDPPYEARRRVLLFKPADAFNTAAANALLKTLEEPPAHAQLILISARPDALPATIRSRCPQVRFTPLTLDEVEQCLDRQAKRPPADRRLLARLAQGRPGTVVGLDLEDYRQQRKIALEFLGLLTQGTPVTRLLKAANYFGKLERPEFEAALDILASLLRDVTCLKAASLASQPGDSMEDVLTHVDIVSKLQALATQLSLKQLQVALDRFEAIRRNLNRNINRVLAMEAALLSLSAGRPMLT